MTISLANELREIMKQWENTGPKIKTPVGAKLAASQEPVSPSSAAKEI